MAEPLFLWLKADLQFIPVMLPEYLARAGAAISGGDEEVGLIRLAGGASRSSTTL